jgi:hypothetical protein
VRCLRKKKKDNLLTSFHSFSKQGKGLQRIGITSVACTSVSVAMSPKDAEDFYSKATENTAKYVEHMKTMGVLPPGLEDQLDIQLKVYKTQLD